MYHLGDPCIHCGQRYAGVEPGPCSKADGLTATVRNIDYLGRVLAEHDKKAAAESARLKGMIAAEQTSLARAEAGLDLDKIALAETVIYATDYARGGTDRNSARQDAIKQISTGEPISPYSDLRRHYFGTKNYDGWRGQREDHQYGYGPRHGSTCFEIGLLAEARKRDLTDAEREAAVYYLVNLERVQAARVAA